MFNKVIDMIDIPLIRRYRGNSRTHFCREANHCKILRASHHWHLPLVANDIWLGGVAQLDQSVIFWPFLAIKPKCRLAIRAKRHWRLKCRWRSGWEICYISAPNKKVLHFGSQPIHSPIPVTAVNSERRLLTYVSVELCSHCPHETTEMCLIVLSIFYAGEFFSLTDLRKLCPKSK